MRPVFACALVFSAMALAADVPVRSSTVTLLLQFEGERSDEAVEAMKVEFESIMRSAGLKFDYKLRSELDDSASLTDLILVKFKGRCRMERLPALFDERGPYGATHVSDGQVLPFSEIACDRVRVSVRSSMTGEHLKNSQYVFGRALGRVLAHEAYHILANTTGHGCAGVGKTGLTPAELVAADLQFHEHEIAKLRRRSAD